MSEDTVDTWLRRLEGDHLPVLRRTIGLLKSAESFEEAHQNRITEAIMSDAGMTSRVLRLANTVPFARQRKLTSLSRAIMCLGYQTIQALGVAAALLEGLDEPCREILSRYLRRAVQRAVVAREMALLCGIEERDEAYVAGLLHDLGQMLVVVWLWEKKGRLLEDDDPQWREIPSARLTAQLARQWQLSPILPEVLCGPVVTPLAEVIAASDEVVKWLEQDPGSAVVRVRWPQALPMEGDDVAPWLETMRSLAEETAERAGFSGKAKLREQPQEQVSPKVNRDLLLELLSDLLSMGRGQTLDLNQLLHALVEGVHRAAGFSTVAVSLELPGKDVLEMRWLVGDKAGALKRLLSVKHDVVSQDPLLSRVWSEGESLLATPEQVDGLEPEWQCVKPAGLLAQWPEGWVALPLRYKGRTLAVIVASTPGVMRADALRAATLLTHQAQLCLEAQGA